MSAKKPPGRRGPGPKRQVEGQYSGVLRKRIPAGASDVTYTAAVAAKFAALFDHHEIPRGPHASRMELLAIALAYAHVPGFKEQTRNVGGAAKSFQWTERTLLTLYLLVESRIIQLQVAGHRHEIVWAVLAVAADFLRAFPQALRKGKPISEHTLRKKYHEAKKRWGSGPDGVVRAILEVVRPKGALE